MTERSDDPFQHPGPEFDTAGVSTRRTIRELSEHRSPSGDWARGIVNGAEPLPSVPEKLDDLSWSMTVVMALGVAVVINLAFDGEWLAAWASLLTTFAGLFALAEVAE